MKILRAVVVFAAGALAVRAQESAPPDRGYILAVDMTREGKKVAPPTAENPTYYVPVFLGYAEKGALFTEFERKPADEEALKRSLVAALAKKHYMVCSKEFPPTMTIAFEWGSIGPVYDRRRVINQGEIRQTVLGLASQDTRSSLAGNSQELLSLTPRHYLLISAFEYSRTPRKDEVLLWRAHSTTDGWGSFLENEFAPLLALAAPALGRETKPGMTWTTKEGRVIIGDPVVKGSP